MCLFMRVYYKNSAGLLSGCEYCIDGKHDRHSCSSKSTREIDMKMSKKK